MTEQSASSLAFLNGGGEMGALMRAHDWSRSSLGPPPEWPQALRTAVRILLNTGHPMYIFWGADHACLYNDAYSESIGPERHPVSLGAPGREVWDEIWPIIGPQIDQVMAGRGATWHVNQLVPITRHGRHEDVYWTYSYSPIDDDTATTGVGGVLVVCSETTQQVITTQRLQRSETQYRVLAEELRQALTREQQARVEADAASRTKDEFLAVLGHELRNPLAPILTALELMRRQAPDALGREREVIQRQVTHLKRLVDDLLDISRVAQGKVDIKTAPIELGDVVAGAVELASPLFEQRRQSVAITVPHTGLVVQADATRLTQVVVNLLNNAAKYGQTGGRISVTARRDDGHVALSVEDDGAGISEDLLPRVFDLFTQEPRSADRAPGGLGIGLAIVKALVELHGGTVDATSDGANRGSRFTIRLPIDTGAVHAQTAYRAPASARVAVASAARRVLIVDDNRDAADLLAEAIANLGHQTWVAYDGPSALTVARDVTPEIALLDLGLPVMDGYELAQELRALADGHAMALVAVTGYGQAIDRERSAAAGFHAHMAKPTPIDALATVISELSRDRSHTPDA